MNKYAIVAIICLSFLAGLANFEKIAEKTSTLVSFSKTSQPRDKDQIKKSIIKIASQGRQGTGFVVGVIQDTAYILTITHVVASDPTPNIEFFGQLKKFKAKVLEIEGQQENGFALLTVTEAPLDAIPLYVNDQSDLKPGDSVFTFGFPRSAGNWAYDELSYSSRIAREILFSGSDIKEGNSGSPLIKGDEVVGIVTSVTDFAHANSSSSIREFLRGAKEGNIVLDHMEKWQKVTMPLPKTPDVPAKSSEEEKAPKEPSNGLIMAMPSPPIDNKTNKTSSEESSAKIEEKNSQQLLALTEQQRIAIAAEAEKEVSRIAAEAEKEASRIAAEAEKEASRIADEAEKEASRIAAEAEKVASQIAAEIKQKQQLAEQQRIAVEKATVAKEAESEQKQQLAEQQPIIAASDDELARLRQENERLRNANILPTEKVTPPSKPGQSFRDKLKDGSLGPEMVQIPAGTFQMGSNDGEDYEKPVHTVSVESFAMGKYEVTRGEFKKFVEATNYQTDAEKGHEGNGCTVIYGSDWDINNRLNWKNPSFKQDDKHPVVCVSWNDAKNYVRWLSEQTEKSYHLPSEAQWEYVAKTVGSKYCWGDNANESCRYGNIADENAKVIRRYFDKTARITARCNDGYVFTSPVGIFLPNKFGLYDITGNVLEWSDDAWHHNYTGAPIDGSSWINGEDNGIRVVRGSSWVFNSKNCTNRSNSNYHADASSYNLGFRIARIVSLDILQKQE